MMASVNVRVLSGIRGDVKIPTYKPHTNHKKPSVSSHTLAPTTICDLSHSVCRSPLTDLGHICSVTYVCHPLWFVCGHRKGILTFPLIYSLKAVLSNIMIYGRIMPYKPHSKFMKYHSIFRLNVRNASPMHSVNFSLLEFDTLNLIAER